MKRIQKSLVASLCSLTAFVLWTAIVCHVDVRQIGPQGSSVGLAGINQFVHSLTGVHFNLYHITDLLGLVPVGICFGFAALGLAQWIKRKHIGKVDFSILVLGSFYGITLAAYLLFERIVVNYRPVLIDGVLEASYPSSTTILTICVMSTAILQLHNRIKNRALKKIVSFAMTAFLIFMVIGRLLSGVHWFSDIVGGVLLSMGLVMLYHTLVSAATP